jgi:hypothetical protein
MRKKSVESYKLALKEEGREMVLALIVILGKIRILIYN